MSAIGAFTTLGFLVVVFSVVFVMSRRRRRFETPLRIAASAREVPTFITSVAARVSWLGQEVSVKGRLQLVIWGDIVEVSQPLPLARFITGQEYFFLARETTVTIIPGRQDWILIEGHWRGRLTQVWVSDGGMTREIWNALVRAGASPGEPPAPAARANPTV
jgi:hypothetical protein